MCPWAIHGLHPADDSFFKIEAALPPAKDLRNGGFAFERAVDGVTEGAVLQIDLTVPATRLEGEAAAPLAQAAHLQDLGGGKLIQVSDERVARIDSLRRLPRVGVERA